MTETLEVLRRRLDAADELHSVTRTMKGLAAVSVRQFESVADALDRYEAVVDQGLQIVLRDPERARAVVASDEATRPRPGSPTPSAVVVFGSNQGLCGPINRHVAVMTAERFADAGGALVEVVAIGHRLGVELELADLAPTRHLDLPGTVEGVTPRAEELLLLVDDWRATLPGLTVWLAYPRFGGRHGRYEPVIDQLLPTDVEHLRHLAARPWPTRMLPTHTMPWRDLYAALTRQALLVKLNRSFAQTMAAIAASRLAAMEIAERDIAERLDDLRQRHHRVRQSKITEELLDVVSGFEILSE